MTKRPILAFLLLATLSLAGPAAALPPAPTADIADLLGQYGTADNILTIYESEGGLYADGRGLKEEPLSPTGSGRDRAGRSKITFVGKGPQEIAILDGERLPRHDFGAEVMAAVRAKVKADPPALRAQALAASPPVETGKQAADLVDLTTVDRRIKLDIRYATANNFMGFPLYERAAAYMQRPAAEALGRAQKALAAQGYGLLIYDAYRPWFVTKMFWEATPPASRVFVADPRRGRSTTAAARST
jgi:D-alanyl-D-alanine dipeptidase